MRTFFISIMGGVLVLCLSMSLSSCEGAFDDVFGEWDRPSNNEKKPTPTMIETPLTIEAITSGTIKVVNPKTGMQYSLNSGDKAAVSGDIFMAAGDKLQFYGTGTTITSYGEISPCTKIQGDGSLDFKCKVYGNIMSLLDETNFAKATILKATFTFNILFFDNTNLIDASDLQLPATSLTNFCYRGMFQGCTNLISAPTLPATTMARDCYTGMFLNCTSLTTAPKLPATTLASSCYTGMFQGCSSLTTAPELPATSLVEDCYNGMFQGCTNLISAPTLPATTLVTNCYTGMFYDCTSLKSITCLATDISAPGSTYDWVKNVSPTGTFTKASGIDWSGKTGDNGIPSGWTVLP